MGMMRELMSWMFHFTAVLQSILKATIELSGVTPLLFTYVPECFGRPDKEEPRNRQPFDQALWEKERPEVGKEKEIILMTYSYHCEIHF